MLRRITVVVRQRDGVDAEQVAECGVNECQGGAQVREGMFVLVMRDAGFEFRSNHGKIVCAQEVKRAGALIYARFGLRTTALNRDFRCL